MQNFWQLITSMQCDEDLLVNIIDLDMCLELHAVFERQTEVEIIEGHECVIYPINIGAFCFNYLKQPPAHHPKIY